MLAAALAALILLPAHLASRLGSQAWASWALYLAFFGSGTVSRMLRYGRLAPAGQDAQRSSPGARLALLLFAGVAVPASHFATWWDTSSLAALQAAAACSGSVGAVAAASAAPRVLPWLGYALMLAGWALNAAAAAQLGKARSGMGRPAVCTPS